MTEDYRRTPQSPSEILNMHMKKPKVIFNHQLAEWQRRIGHESLEIEEESTYLEQTVSRG